MPTAPDRSLDRLLDRLEQLASILAWPEDRLYVRVPSVSAWSPAQHADHAIRSLDAMLGAIEALRGGDAPDIHEGGRMRLVGRVVLLTGWIPRGRGEAPAAYRPDPRPVRHRMRDALGEVASRARSLAESLRGEGGHGGTIPHPILGAFDLSAWARFADLHTHHHLKIVADVDRHRAIGERDADAEAEARAAGERDLGIGPEPS